MESRLPVPNDVQTMHGSEHVSSFRAATDEGDDRKSATMKKMRRTNGTRIRN
jgi:hypothetical protein